MTDGGGGRERGREGGQWDPSSSSLPPSTSSKTIVIRFISLIRFSLSAEGERVGGEGESRFRGHFVFGFTYWAGISLCDHFQTQIIAPYKFGRNSKERQ